MYLGQLEGDQYQHEREYVAEVVAGIGEQRQRPFEKSDGCLHAYEQEVQRDGKDEDAVERGHLRGVMVVVMMVFVCHNVIFFCCFWVQR